MNQERRRLLNRPILLAIPILIGLFITRSPLFMASTTPAPSKPWADAPLKLIITPQYETKKTDLFATGATHMALLHNSIFRGYNSIYQQAPNVKDIDKNDFIGYALTWYKFVKSHHDDEEVSLFTKVEEVLDDKTIWDGTHKEHEAFLPGLAEFGRYLSTLRSPKDFSGDELRRIMSSFQESFETHFHSEISTIANLADHPNAPKAGSQEEADASLTFKTWGKSTVTKAGTLDVVPFFLLNLDGTVEDGLWADWPSIPAPIKWGLINIGGAYHNRWWKFSSCSSGKPRQLYAV
ncbi:putative hemerythrin hhe cation binding domain-containing protein [Rosellinia necatrix]|uniref:Putative hemerythrin hhe cation binding domain-containing protein n=1 Tax=Rosellinia necatrix TaxID=77044 RepID=A0A1W2TJ82_ROSNE|nr:putative hemerythrin hhe cation binding domain-containing protein [Rosellinia necatrix]